MLVLECTLISSLILAFFVSFPCISYLLPNCDCLKVEGRVCMLLHFLGGSLLFPSISAVCYLEFVPLPAADQADLCPLCLKSNH